MFYWVESFGVFFLLYLQAYQIELGAFVVLPWLFSGLWALSQAVWFLCCSQSTSVETPEPEINQLKLFIHDHSDYQIERKRES